MPKRFNIRDLVFLTLIAAIAFGWYRDRQYLKSRIFSPTGESLARKLAVDEYIETTKLLKTVCVQAEYGAAVRQYMDRFARKPKLEDLVAEGLVTRSADGWGRLMRVSHYTRSGKGWVVRSSSSPHHVRTTFDQEGRLTEIVYGPGMFPEVGDLLRRVMQLREPRQAVYWSL
jgi:hypothetical protein